MGQVECLQLVEIPSWLPPSSLFFKYQTRLSAGSEDQGDKDLKKKGKKSSFLGEWGIDEFREMHFDFLAPVKSTLDVNDYELKMRQPTIDDCFSLAVLRYMGIGME